MWYVGSSSFSHCARLDHLHASQTASTLDVTGKDGIRASTAILGDDSPRGYRGVSIFCPAFECIHRLASPNHLLFDSSACSSEIPKPLAVPESEHGTGPWLVSILPSVFS